MNFFTHEEPIEGGWNTGDRKTGNMISTRKWKICKSKHQINYLEQGKDISPYIPRGKEKSLRAGKEDCWSVPNNEEKDWSPY
jgi:hypothetical protein